MNRLIVKKTHHGFTLLELILVVFIMGTLAAISTTFIENEDSQLRYEQSINKLNAINDAVIKVRDYKNGMVMSGFVFDNGVLPPIPTGGTAIELQPLIGKHDDWSTDSGSSEEWEDYGGKTPVYTTNVSEDPVGISVKVFKGYRGPYLASSQLDSNDEYRDAWGEEFDVDLVGSSYHLTHTATVNGQQKFNGVFDKTNTVAIDDWSVPLNGVSFTITNDSLTDTLSWTDKYLALLLYKNSATGARWETYRVQLASVLTGELAQGESIILSSPVMALAKWVDGAEDPEDDTDVDFGSFRVPVGSNVFVVIDESKLNEDPLLAIAVETVFPRTSWPVIELTVN